MELASINRNVLVTRPTQAMLDWMNGLSPDDEPLAMTMEGHDESNVYLIKETDSIEQAQRWLRKNFKPIFAYELWEWWTDETAWPPLTWKNFEKFVHYRIHTVVMDAMGGGIFYDRC